MSYIVKLNMFPLAKDEILDYLDKENIKYNEFFKQYLSHEKYKSVTESKTINIEILKLSELGLDRPSNFEEIKKAALSKGLGLCEANTGFYLRLELKNQKQSSNSILSNHKNPDSSINVFSDKLEESFEFPRNTYIRNLDNVLLIRSSRFDDLYEFEVDSEFAFLKKL